MKIISSIILGICLISLASAVSYNLIAGENQTIDLGQSYEYYSIVGNSTPINLTISQEGTIATIYIDKYSAQDTFEIIFFNKEKEIIYQSSGGGGGSSGGGGGYIIKYQEKNNTIYKDNIIEVEKIVNVTDSNVDNKKGSIMFNLIILAIGLLIGFIVFYIISILFINN